VTSLTVKASPSGVPSVFRISARMRVPSFGPVEVELISCQVMTMRPSIRVAVDVGSYLVPFMGPQTTAAKIEPQSVG